MAHLLTPAPTTAVTALSAKAGKNSLNSWKNGCFPTPTVCFVGPHYQHQPFSISDQDHAPPPSNHQSLPLPRRALMGLSGAVVLGLSLSDEQSASAASRPPPPPPKEKMDPNVSGVQAKVLASKRRKEAMKQEVAKLREKGKPINNEPPPPPPPPPAPAPAPASE